MTHARVQTISLPKLLAQEKANAPEVLPELPLAFSPLGLPARQYLQFPCPNPGEIPMQDDVVALFAYDRWANRNELFDFAWRWHEVLIWHLNSFLRPLAIGLGILQSS